MFEAEDHDSSSSVRDETLGDLIGFEPVHVPVSRRVDFAPWHRPRKQYIRRQQWLREIMYLTRDLKLSGKEFRYLTLPGEDFLDIRYFQNGHFIPKGVTLRYLGFDNSTGVVPDSAGLLEASRFEARLSGIHPESRVLDSDIREIGKVQSVAWTTLRQFGSFHAINLDLCNGVASESRNAGSPNYFQSLDWMLRNQSHGDDEFLLFVTTRVEFDTRPNAAEERFPQLIAGFAEACHDYKFSLSTAFPAFLVKSFAGLNTTQTYVLGFVHWLMTRARDHGISGSLRSVISYRTGENAGDDDLVSLAFRFKPTHVLPEDRSGLAGSPDTVSSQSISLCAQSAPVPGKVATMLALDAHLDENGDELLECIQESMDLLATAGFDAEKYYDWAFERGGGLLRDELKEDAQAT